MERRRRVGICIAVDSIGEGCASTAPMTAAAVLVPSERKSALSPFEAPVSLCGTERMMSIGIAAKPKPMPTPMRMFATKMCHTSLPRRAA